MRYPAIPPYIPPKKKLPNNIIGIVKIILVFKFIPIAVAIIAPIIIWPSAPMFSTLLWNAIDIEIPISISGVAFTRLSEIAFSDPNDDLKKDPTPFIGFNPMTIIIMKKNMNDTMTEDRELINLCLSDMFSLLFISIFNLFSMISLIVVPPY